MNLSLLNRNVKSANSNEDCNVFSLISPVLIKAYDITDIEVAFFLIEAVVVA